MMGWFKLSRPAMFDLGTSHTAPYSITVTPTLTDPKPTWTPSCRACLPPGKFLMAFDECVSCNIMEGERANVSAMLTLLIEFPAN